MKAQLRTVLMLVIHRLPPALFTRRGIPRSLLGVYFTSLAEHPRNFERRLAKDIRFQGNTGDLIQRFVFVFGVWEPAVTAWFRRVLRPGDVVLDVGANTGYFSLLAGRLVGETGRVIAFEPVTVIADSLRDGLRVNRATNVVVKESALSDSSGDVEIFMATDGNIGNSSTLRGDNRISAGFVPQRTLDDEVTADLASRLRLIKIDTEGSELAVLRGARRTLAAMPAGSSVLVEITPALLHSQDESADAIGELLPADVWEVLDVGNAYTLEAYLGRPADPTPTALPVTDRADLVFVKKVGPSV